MTDILSVRTPADIDLVVTLAHHIWLEHYPPIIGKAQTDYMLETFQSVPVIARQAAEGYQYYLVMEDRAPAGYVAFLPDIAALTTLLSKLYVRKEYRNRGLGRSMIEFVEARCIEAGMRELWLTVNRHNTGSIAFYRRAGFTVTDSLLTDIGDGFVMDDYRMAKPLHPD
jgi:ribosomal protein S18 acetylase RimI-like enzyme